MINLAHRGYSAKYPENTMLAFRKALERGFDGIECDVHFTKDRYMVICHDEKINRTSNGKGYIKDMTLAELKTYNFNNGMDFNETIPLLEDVLKLVKEKHKLINIEIKTDKIHYEGLEKAVYDLVNELDMQDDVYYSSFYLPSLMHLRELDEDAYIGYLFEYNPDKNNKMAALYNIDNIHPRYNFIDDELMKYYRDNGMKCVGTWTVPDKKEYDRLKALGVDISISNEYFGD